MIPGTEQDRLLTVKEGREQPKVSRRSKDPMLNTSVAYARGISAVIPAESETDSDSLEGGDLRSGAGQGSEVEYTYIYKGTKEVTSGKTIC